GAGGGQGQEAARQARHRRRPRLEARTGTPPARQGVSAGELRLLRGLIPAELIAEAVETLQEMAEALGAPPEGDLDDRISHLAAGDRAALSTIYDAFRESLIFQRIITAEPLVEAARAMSG